MVQVVLLKLSQESDNRINGRVAPAVEKMATPYTTKFLILRTLRNLKGGKDRQTDRIQFINDYLPALQPISLEIKRDLSFYTVSSAGWSEIITDSLLSGSGFRHFHLPPPLSQRKRVLKLCPWGTFIPDCWV